MIEALKTAQHPRPPVNLDVIRRQLEAITNYLKTEVWSRKASAELKPEQTT